MARAPVVVLAALVLLFAIAVTTAQAAPPAYDIRGTWQGGGASNGVSGSVTWQTEDCTTGVISGQGSSGSKTFAASGTINGVSVTVTFGPFDQDKTYSITAVGTFTDPNHLSGTFHDTATYKDKPGNFQLVRSSGPPQDGKGCGTPNRTTATTVSCNYSVATGANTCTATVGDAGDLPRVTPTGPVTFTSQSGGSLLCRRLLHAGAHSPVTRRRELRGAMAAAEQ